MLLQSLPVLLCLLVFICVVNAQGSCVINRISLPDGNVADQGAPVSSGVDFTEDNEFVDSVSGYPRNFVAVVDRQGSHRELRATSRPNRLAGQRG